MVNADNAVGVELRDVRRCHIVGIAARIPAEKHISVGGGENSLSVLRVVRDRIAITVFYKTNVKVVLMLRKVHAVVKPCGKPRLTGGI